MHYEEVAIVTTKKTCKKNSNRRQLRKANPIKGSYVSRVKQARNGSGDDDKVGGGGDP